MAREITPKEREELERQCSHEWGMVLDEKNIPWRQCRLCLARHAPSGEELASIQTLPSNVVQGETAVLHFVADQEPMSVYELEDGTIVKAKAILMHAERIIDKYTPDGQPMYGLSFQQVLYVHAPPELRKKPQ